MSTYEQYDRVSASYDSTRVPIGAEIIAGCLTTGGRQLAEVTLLDAGCGTGAYAEALIGQVGQIHAVDMSAGMLRVARAKLGDEAAAGRVRFDRASVLELPYGDMSFDGVMVNQMLHHLETGEADDYPGHRRALAEFHRVLRPDGVLVINACSHAQIRRGFWYYDLLPEAVEAVSKRNITMPVLVAMLAEVGFGTSARIVPLDALMFDEAYFDRRGPLDATWRQGDSIWSLASAAEIDRATARIRELDAAGRLDAYFIERDRTRIDVGQTTFVHTVKNH